MSKSEVMSARDRVTRFYEVGRASLKRNPGRMHYGAAETEARIFGLSAELLRKARQFADPVRGYSLNELRAVLRLSQKTGFALGTTHIIRWLTIPKQRRARIERRTIAGRWNMSRVEAEIRKEFGARRFGGRRRQIPADTLGVLVQLESLCDEWSLA